MVCSRLVGFQEEYFQDGKARADWRCRYLKRVHDTGSLLTSQALFEALAPLTHGII
jgi:hypothetical protein